MKNRRILAFILVAVIVFSAGILGIWAKNNVDAFAFAKEVNAIKNDSAVDFSEMIAYDLNGNLITIDVNNIHVVGTFLRADDIFDVYSCVSQTCGDTECEIFVSVE
ncbi:MAG: hypothetical protein FWG36_06495 [Oscillospiraceae bacterium]|nr:hypothetical protein [Oscillospiraceae bacterium]